MAQVYIHEDGTFTKRDRKALSALFPMATIIDYRASTQKAISKWLVDYPVTRGYRANPDFIWTVKLIDPFFISTRPYVLVLDTDLLWFKKPWDLFDHLDDFRQPIFWPANSSWNFPLKGGESLRSGPLNTGLVLYERRRFQLDLIEEFCQKIGPDLGPPLLDQPGYVYTLAKLVNPAALPIERYIIKGPVRERTVAKHYTGPRREQFWFEGVRLLHKELFS